MIEAEADFSQVQVEVALRQAAQRIQPVLGVAPEALDAVDVVAPDGATLLLADDHVLAAHRQGRVGLPSM